MPTSYTSLLGLALPVTGELAGTWGDTVNDYISKYVDSSVAGTQTISGSQTAVTLTRANGAALSQAGSGTTGSSQYQVINCTGNPAGTLTVTIDVSTGSPTLSNSTYSQTFAVINGTSTSQSVVVRATTTSGTSTGTTLVSGEKALIAWNGSDFIKVATSTVDGVSTIAFGTTGLTPSTATSGAVTVAGTLVAANGGTGQSSYTTGDLLYATGSTALSKLGIGTNGQILTSTGTAPQWSTLSGVAVTTFSAGTTGFTPSSATSGAVTLAGTLATTNGGTGLTSFTANRVFYASSTSAIGQSANLTFDGTTLTAANFTDSSLTSGRVTYATTGGNLTDSANLTFDGTNLTLGGGTANGVAYLNGSKVLTTGSALTFDGTTLGVANGVAGGTSLSLTGSYTGSGNVNLISFQRFGGAVAGALRYSDDNPFGMMFGTTTSHAQIFMTANTERMRISSAGDVGIGTSSPAAKLDVQGGNTRLLREGAVLQFATYAYSSTQSFHDARWTAWRARGTAASPSVVQAGDELSAWEISGYNANNDWTYAGGIRAYATGTITGGNVPSYLTFETSAGSSGIERMRLDSSGNLGIGTSPTAGYKLDVNGNINIQGATPTINASDSNAVLTIQQSSGVSGRLELQGAESIRFTTYLSSWSERGRFSADGTFRVKGAGTAGSTDAVQFAGSAPASSLTLDAGGRLGIGNTSPAYILDIDSKTNSPVIRLTSLASGQIPYRISANIPGVSNSGFSIYDETASANRLVIDSSGNLGVGTASPINNSGYGGLSLNGTSGALLSLITNGTESSRIASISNETSIQCKATTGYITFVQGVSGGTERARITSGGNLGLGFGGAFSALANLDILTGGQGGGIQLVRNASGNPTSGQSLGSFAWKGIDSANTNAAAEAMIEAVAAENQTGSTAATNMLFYTKPSGTGPGSAPTERFRIASNGAWGLAGANYGTSGQVLTSNGSGSAPTWQTVGGGSAAGSSGQVQFNNSGAFGATSNFFWDNGNGRLGIMTSTPSLKLDIKGGNGDQINLNNGGERFTQATWQNNGTNKGALWVDNTNSLFEIVGYSGIGLTFQTALTERMRIDTSGNVGIGTSSPTDTASFSRALDLNGSLGAAFYARTNGSSTNVTTFGNYGADGYINNRAAGIFYFFNGNAERAQINSSGYFKASDAGTYVSSTGSYHEFRQTNASNQGVVLSCTNGSFTSIALQIRADRNTTNDTFYAIRYFNDGAGAYKFNVADSGNVTNTNGSYGTISDAKMKTDIVDAGSQWADIKAIRFRKFKMKDDPSGLVQLGVVAQELEQTSPGLVAEHKDVDGEGVDLGTTTKSVKTSILLMKAAVALQEAMARIEQLEAKVAALEAK